MEHLSVLGLPLKGLAAAFLLMTTLTGLQAPAAHGSQQAPDGTVTIDAPTVGAPAVMGRPSGIGGWAVRASTRGTGVERVDVYLDGPPGTGSHIGTARYGVPRRDVAAVFNRPDWTNSGFDLEWTPRNISPGDHVLHVVAQGASGPALAGAVNVSVSRADEGQCSFVQRCYLYRNSYGWWVDEGGPGLRLDYFPYYGGR